LKQKSNCITLPKEVFMQFQYSLAERMVFAAQLWLFCPRCLGNLSTDIRDFIGPTDDNPMTWHRLHYHDYLYAKDGHPFCPECLCVEP